MKFDRPGKRLSSATALFFFLGYGTHAQGQQKTSPLTEDFARISPTLYFPSTRVEEESRQMLHDRVPATTKNLNQVEDAALVVELDRAWELISQLQRHAAFLRVQSLEDTQNKSVEAGAAAVDSDEAIVTAAIFARLQRVDSKQMSFLGKYEKLAQRAKTQQDHELSPQVESYRGRVTYRIESNIADAYDRTIEQLQVAVGDERADVSIRRAARRQSSVRYEAAAPRVATLLATLVDVENSDASAEGYANAADRKYAQLGFTATLVNKTLAAVASEAPAYRRYEEVLARHVQQQLRLSQVHVDDLDLAATPATHLPFAEGRNLILDSFAPLGSDYVQRFAQLLDPKSGRLDLAGGPHRSRTGTSIAVYDGSVALYVGGFDGSLLKLSTVAHEGGHAIHRELMNDSGIPIYERDGPHFLSEGFAILNEILLLDHAVKVAINPEQRQYALERLLAKLSLELFTSAEETSFEQKLYTRTAQSGVLDREMIDQLYQEAIAPYEYWPMGDVGTSRSWMRKSLLFEDPLYLVNYLYASVVAVALYEESQIDPQFGPKYEALLRRGFDADPVTLLDSVGIRLDQPGLVTAAAELFRRKTDELESLYTRSK